VGKFDENQAYHIVIIEIFEVSYKEKAVSFFGWVVTMKNPKSIRALFAFPGFTAAPK